MPAKVILSVTEGPIQGTLYTFEEHDTFIFGRASDCHARLSPDDTTASRHHFILEANPPDARLRDLGSLNGTYVNDVKYGGRASDETPEQAATRRFPEIDLKHGDTINVGDTVFEVQIESQVAAVPIDFHVLQTEVSSPEVMRCGLCGKDVEAEVGSNRRGDYICHSCQQKVQSDPAIVVVHELRAHDRDPTRPNDIAGYNLECKLGEGGMGAVYLGRNVITGETAAIKVMLAKVAVDEDSRQRFQREIEVTRQLRHTNIVLLIEQGSTGSGFYFVMEFCSGGDLDDLIERHGGRVPLSEAAPVMLNALDGLAYAHSQGCIHRDIKPQNILLAGQFGEIAKISDFGLAKNFQQAGLSGMTATGMMAGSLAFMSRDQLVNFKYAKPVSDVWSMGATFYYMLTGRPPRDFPVGQDPVAVILNRNVVPITDRNASIPEKVAVVIDRATTDNVKQRYQTAREFREALAAAL